MASHTRTSRGGSRAGGSRRIERLERVAEAYFHWLVEQVREDQEGHPRRTYWDLLRVMHETEFVWFVPNDDNRLMDGLALREEYLADNAPFDSISGPCSVLEVMIALSRRVAFAAGGSAEGWAWQLLCNLELDKMWDPISPRKLTKANEILHRLVWRTYAPDGMGGFFPLAWPEDDQRKVEIWYQMAGYINEIHPEY